FLRNWPYVYALANSEGSPVKGHVDVTYLPQGDGPSASHAATLGGWQIKLSRLPTRPALYEDKEVLAAEPWFSSSLPVFKNVVARPSTATGANYNRVSTDFFQTTNQILTGGISVDKGVETMESKMKRDMKD